VSPAQALARARAASAAAELAADRGDLRTAQALRGAAATWERLARPGVLWSMEPTRRALRLVKRELAVATGPFQPPAPPKAPLPAKQLAVEATRDHVTIEF
jgi:hypothetical protein